MRRLQHKKQLAKFKEISSEYNTEHIPRFHLENNDSFSRIKGIHASSFLLKHVISEKKDLKQQMKLFIYSPYHTDADARKEFFNKCVLLYEISQKRY